MKATATQFAARDRRLNFRCVGRQVLVWLLCLCVWRGPIPVLHCHETGPGSLAAISAVEQAQLLSHLQHYHADAEMMDRQGQSEKAHWHLHFVLPSSCPDGDSEDSLYIPAQPLCAVAVTDTHFTASSSPPVDWLTDYQMTTMPGGQTVSAADGPRLIPLAPPRVRPKRLTPVIAFCTALC